MISTDNLFKTFHSSTIKIIPLGDFGVGHKTILSKIKYGPDFTESSINDSKFKSLCDLKDNFLNVKVEDS